MKVKSFKSFNEGNSEIIDEFIDKHSDRYDYSKVNYVNSKTNVEIICPIHGSFFQNPYYHKKGSNCPECSNNKRGSNDSFIKNAKLKHGNKYDYSKVNYINNSTKVKIICPIHGEFEQSPNVHILKGSNCPKCYGRNKNNNNFIEDARKIHSDKYDYSDIDYKGAHDKIDIICPIHGSFSMSYNSHITKGYGCPTCRETSGESYIKTILNKYNIIFEYQKKFSDCKYKRVLTFDFYLPTKNLIIEYDGRQHFMAIWSGVEGLNIIKKRDEIKTNYCNSKNIKILRIKYDEDVEKKIKEIL